MRMKTLRNELVAAALLILASVALIIVLVAIAIPPEGPPTLR